MWIDGQVPDIVESDQAFPTEENSRGDNWVAVVINETKLSNAVSVLSSPSASISFFLFFFFLHITEMNRQCETTTSPPPLPATSHSIRTVLFRWIIFGLSQQISLLFISIIFSFLSICFEDI